MSEKKKEFTKFCNKLRCPLCDAQLDGGVSEKSANLYCVNRNDEYRCQWLPNDETPVFEKITYYYSQYRYEIKLQRIANGSFITTVDRLNQDFNSLHIESSRKRVFDYSGDRLLFFRTRMEEPQFLKKLKIYNLFS